MPNISYYKHINNAIWETLSKARNGDEQLVQEGEVQNEYDIFYTPLESPKKEDFIGSDSVVSNKGIHSEVTSAHATCLYC